MNSKLFYVLCAIVVLGGAGYLAWTSWTLPSTDFADFDVDLDEGQKLYAASCAACHGANLEGQPDWQSPGEDGQLPAPPHDETGHTWHHPDSLLFKYTKLGGQKTLAEEGVEFTSGMPGFEDQLSDEEIWNILAYIKSTWPERFQKIQADRTAAES